ncbi:MAG: RagB/SusD family nutrient uptake outer membrane protein [Paludibacteraceae bacterium]|nr:RagB/SusD family nutrient uptake outer membrane protein [Paludibacteraceae bacterium]
MKRIYFVIMAVVAVMATGCKDNKFLDLKDPDSFDDSKFYRDSADMEGLLSSAYQAMRPAYDKLFFVTEMKSDNTTTTDMGTSGGLYYTFVSHNVTSSNTIVAEIYNSFYFCIHRCNVLLEHIDDVPMGDADKARIKGEAMFLRALSHFYLVRLWGPVTIMRHTVSGTEETKKLKRNSVEEVYDFIIEDLQTIADGSMLPANCTGARFGHASRTAACALLGKVYLQQAATQGMSSRYNNAITYLEKALTVSGYTGFGKAYNKLFTLEGQTDEEIIFPIMYMANADEGSNFAQYFQPSGATGLTSALPGRGFNAGQENLFNEFEDTKNGFPVMDRARLSWAIRPYNSTYYTKKYIDTNPSGYGGNIWFELRFGDVYLMLAEAYERVEGNASANAIMYLDKVRTTRPSSTLKDYATSMANATYAAAYPTLRAAIFHERRTEMCFENQRWFDLMRLYPNANDFVTYMRSVNEPNVGAKYTAFQAYEILLPIPYDEVFINPDLGQNEGY